MLSTCAYFHMNTCEQSCCTFTIAQETTAIALLLRSYFRDTPLVFLTHQLFQYHTVVPPSAARRYNCLIHTGTARRLPDHGEDGNLRHMKLRTRVPGRVRRSSAWRALAGPPGLGAARHGGSTRTLRMARRVAGLLAGFSLQPLTAHARCFLFTRQ